MKVIYIYSSNPVYPCIDLNPLMWMILLNGPVEKRIPSHSSDGYTAVEIPQFTLDAQNLTQDISQTSPWQNIRLISMFLQ